MAQRPPSQNAEGGSDNPIEAYFDGYSEGPGIWKWKHYFEIYHRHLAKFVGRPANILEIGIYRDLQRRKSPHVARILRL